MNHWWAQVGSNHSPLRYQHSALPTELWAQMMPTFLDFNFSPLIFNININIYKRF